jgi:hypothetical protein
MQPALLPPPEAPSGPLVFGSKTALLNWLLKMGGAGEGPAVIASHLSAQPAESTAGGGGGGGGGAAAAAAGGGEVPTGGARGGVHPYVGYKGGARGRTEVEGGGQGGGGVRGGGVRGGGRGGGGHRTTVTLVVPAGAHAAGVEEGGGGGVGWYSEGWWAAADHVVSLVESLRDRLDFTSGAYTLTKAVAIRHVTVNPVPFPRVGRLRFARLGLYQYLAVEGPKQATALQVYC